MNLVSWMMVIKEIKKGERGRRKSWAEIDWKCHINWSIMMLPCRCYLFCDRRKIPNLTRWLNTRWDFDFMLLWRRNVVRGKRPENLSGKTFPTSSSKFSCLRYSSLALLLNVFNFNFKCALFITFVRTSFLGKKPWEKHFIFMGKITSTIRSPKKVFSEF